ncbi:hypothetical protein CPY51_32075 [Rhizobium tubonense]|uniref:Uncharacterized protein n=1 Tax=Rhizobium tubonense TaxID=484088 RepID=A0A2W4C0S3_9HYPH|nr:hypothetical protein CPY51_32075 [Rhizobium tubonense]
MPQTLRRSFRNVPALPLPTGLSAALASVGDRDAGFSLPHGRGDEFFHHVAPRPDPRGMPKGPRPRDIVDSLCRTRHKGSYPEPETMPIRLPKPRDFL